MMGLCSKRLMSLETRGAREMPTNGPARQDLTGGPNHELQIVNRELRPVCVVPSLLVKLTLNQHLQLLNRFVRIRSLGRDE